jgi:hypothetical protein
VCVCVCVCVCVVCIVCAGFGPHGIFHESKSVAIGFGIP